MLEVGVGGWLHGFDPGPATGPSGVKRCERSGGRLGGNGNGRVCPHACSTACQNRPEATHNCWPGGIMTLEGNPRPPSPETGEWLTDQTTAPSRRISGA